MEISEYLEAVKMLVKNKLGKVLPDAVYVHSSLWFSIEEGFSDELQKQAFYLMHLFNGSDFNDVNDIIIKLNRKKFVISFLQYKDFVDSEHPVLHSSYLKNFETGELKFTDFSSRVNKPILHRVEQMMYPGPSQSLRLKLTEQEEAHGLYEKPNSIGTQKGWDAVLENKNVAIHNFEVLQL